MSRRDKAVATVHYGIFAGAIAALSVWTAFYAQPYNIARVADGGRAALELRAVLAYGQLPLAGSLGSLAGDGLHPSLPLFIHQILFRAGFETAYPFHLLAIFLNLLSIGLLYLFLRVLFHNRWIGLAGAAYVGFTGAYLTEMVGIEGLAYARVFSLSACLAFLWRLRGGKPAYGWAAGAAYVLACWSLGEQLLATGILLWGVHYAERRRRYTRELAPLFSAALPALAGMALFALLPQEEAARAATAAINALPEKASALPLTNLGEYLDKLSESVTQMFYLSPSLWALMLAAALCLCADARRAAYGILPFVLGSAAIWMLQSDWGFESPHPGGPMTLLCALTFGAYAVEIPQYVFRSLGERPFKAMISIALLLPAFYPALDNISQKTIPPMVNVLKMRQHLAANPPGEKTETTASSTTQETAPPAPPVEQPGAKASTPPDAATTAPPSKTSEEPMVKRRATRPQPLPATPQITLPELPKPVFSWREDQPNLLLNGGFEEWRQGNEAPDGFQAPNKQYSTLDVETTEVFSGAASLRQSWRASDVMNPIFSLFGVSVSKLKPKTDYVLIVRAKNCTSSTVTISAWQMKGAQDDPDLRRLDLRVIAIPPSANPQYNECSGVFTTYAESNPFKVYLVARCLFEDGKPPNHVLWDDWELRELGSAEASGE